MKNLDLENLDLEPHDREVKISISSRKLKKVSRRSLVPTRAGEHFGDYQAAMRKPAPVRRGGNEEEEGSSSWRFHHGGPPYVLHILKAMHLSLKMKFLGAILVHPVRDDLP